MFFFRLNTYYRHSHYLEVLKFTMKQFEFILFDTGLIPAWQRGQACRSVQDGGQSMKWPGTRAQYPRDGKTTYLVRVLSNAKKAWPRLILFLTKLFWLMTDYNDFSWVAYSLKLNSWRNVTIPDEVWGNPLVKALHRIHREVLFHLQYEELQSEKPAVISLNWIILNDRPSFGCVLSCLAFEWNWGWSWLAFIENSLLSAVNSY